MQQLTSIAAASFAVVILGRPRLRGRSCECGSGWAASVFSEVEDRACPFRGRRRGPESPFVPAGVPGTDSSGLGRGSCSSGCRVSLAISKYDRADKESGAVWLEGESSTCIRAREIIWMMNQII